jgi:hypothetical protein
MDLDIMVHKSKDDRVRTNRKSQTRVGTFLSKGRRIRHYGDDSSDKKSPLKAVLPE